MNNIAPFQLLEINMISAQDLEPVCRRKMRTYAVAWVHSQRKLSTRIDSQGHTNPTWNDKFVFRVDDEFLYGNTSAVMIEIYAVHWFRDIHVGTVRAIVGNLIPPMSRPQHRREVQLGMQFVALQVWRPSGRPQGILNIGVALLDSSMRSMPLYMQMGSSAVGYRHLMGEEDPFQNSNNNHNPQSSVTKSNYNNNHHQLLLEGLFKPALRRTKSDTSSMLFEVEKPKHVKGGSVINGGGSIRGGSMINGGGSIRGGSMINGGGSIRGGSVINDGGSVRGGSVVNGGGSVVNGGGSIVTGYRRTNSRGSSLVNYMFEKTKKERGGSIINGGEDPFPTKKGGNDRNGKKMVGRSSPKAKSPAGLKFSALDYGAPKIWTDSELGPSPSEVAAAVARNRRNYESREHSMVDGWSLDGSIEGLRSKLERWRTEHPPAYDRGELSSYMSSGVKTGSAASDKTRHVRRHTTDNNGGLFSCFGNICGCEISISCGPSGATAAKKKVKVRRAPSSFDNSSFL